MKDSPQDVIWSHVSLQLAAQLFPEIGGEMTSLMILSRRLGIISETESRGVTHSFIVFPSLLPSYHFLVIKLGETPLMTSAKVYLPHSRNLSALLSVLRGAPSSPLRFDHHLWKPHLITPQESGTFLPKLKSSERTDHCRPSNTCD